MVTISQLSKRTDRSRFTIWYHIRKFGFGKKIGHLFVLTEEEAATIEKHIAALPKGYLYQREQLKKRVN